jgi:hypothetical protein
LKKSNLNKGLTFEETNVFLKWGSCIDSYVISNECTKEILADNTVYFWGKRKIFNGLELPFSTDFSNNGIKRWFRLVNRLEYKVVGDEIAKTEFHTISNHLIENLGEPKVKDESIELNEIYLEWRINKVYISLYLFEQHCYKLHLLIKKNSVFY